MKAVGQGGKELKEKIQSSENQDKKLGDKEIEKLKAS
jgi:hypothetical protein